MPERNRNVWAPWRMEYIEALDDSSEADVCFLCEYAAHGEQDAANHVMLRSEHTLVLLNRFPYTNGHLLISPVEHVADPAEIPASVWAELAERLCSSKRVLDRILEPQGYNIGMNLGRCGGAGLPDHLHWHIVPRWGGDTNFMSVVGDGGVIPQSLDEMVVKFQAAAAELGI